MPRLRRVILAALLLCPEAAHAALRTAVLAPSGDKTGTKLADQVEFNLEDNEDITLEQRDRVTEALDKQNPFGEEALAQAMDTAELDVLVRVVKSGKGYALILYDRDGLDVETLDAGPVKSPADTKAAGGKVTVKVVKTLSSWERKRTARAEKREAELRRAQDQRRKEEEKAEEERRKKEKQKEKSRTAWMDDEGGDNELPAPPDAAPEDARSGRRGPVVGGDDEDLAPPPRKEEPPPKKPEKKPAKPAARAPEPPREKARKPEEGRRALDPDEPTDDVEPRPRRGAPADDAEDGGRPQPKPKPRPKYGEPYAGKEPGGIEGFVKGLYTLHEPIPYFSASVGPSVSAWSYTLREASGRRRASTCSPTVSPSFSFSCIPHGGADLWVEAWPIRYVGVDANARFAGTVYPAARSAQTGRPVTEPATVPSFLLGAQLAAKARFVLHFTPLPESMQQWSPKVARDLLRGIGAGVRVRLGYSRNLVGRQKPFIAIPGYHAVQLALGVESYFPVFYKTLAFDARAEAIPLVYYQEIAGIPADPSEILLPRKTLNNPGAFGRTVGWRFDVGTRLAAPTGLFLEIRAFHEGYFAMFTGSGNRTDINLEPIPDGRVINLTFGITLAVGWLFPKLFDPWSVDDVKKLTGLGGAEPATARP